MFPFQRSGVLSFKVENDGNPSIQDLQDHVILEQHNSNNNLDISHARGQGRGRGRGRRSLSLGSSSSSNVTNNVDDGKKVSHREAERQRRLEMSTLFDALRSVIPIDNLKGKKSVSDHIEEATNYIKDLEKNVKELGEKRDQLKQSTSSGNEVGGLSNSTPPYGVAIRQFTGGLEIEICVKYDDDEFLLSSAFQVAYEEGLDVVSSTSTKSHEIFIHYIQCEVSNVAHVNLNRLEQRFNDLCHRSSDD